MRSARKIRSDTGSTDRLAHTASLGTKRDAVALDAPGLSEDFARCTNSLFAPTTAAAHKTAAVSAMANRRQFLFALITIWRIHTLKYAPTARAADTCVFLAILVSTDPRLIGDFEPLQ